MQDARRFTLLLSILLFSFSCGPSSLVQDRYKEHMAVLRHAYSTHSIAELDSFLLQWSKEITPFKLSENKGISDTVAELYSVFNAYSNHFLQKRENFLDGFTFCMIQNKILYSASESLKYIKDMVYDTLTNFRPFPKSLTVTTLYVSPYYDSLLLNFINIDRVESHDDSDYYNHLWDGWPHAGFLTQRVRLSASMGGFYIRSLPNLRMQFNSTFSSVIVHWSMGSAFGEELYVKSGGRWEFKKLLGVGSS